MAYVSTWIGEAALALTLGILEPGLGGQCQWAGPDPAHHISSLPEQRSRSAYNCAAMKYHNTNTTNNNTHTTTNTSTYKSD